MFCHFPSSVFVCSCYAMLCWLKGSCVMEYVANSYAMVVRLCKIEMGIGNACNNLILNIGGEGG